MTDAHAELGDTIHGASYTQRQVDSSMGRGEGGAPRGEKVPLADQPPEPAELKVGDSGPLGPSRLLAKTAEAARGRRSKILFSISRFCGNLKKA